MLVRQFIAAAKPTVAHSVRHWIYGLGGLGFIPLGLLDSSVIPLPGSMDVLLVVLAARQPQLWLYYALMATLGSVIGGFVTYRLARKGGKESLSRRFSAKTLKRVYAIFEKWGFAAIAIPALLPPPVPLVPFVLTAGAMQYSVKKFLAAMTLGRIARYLFLSYLAEQYGRKMLPFILHHAHPVLLGVVGLIAVVALILFYIFAGKKRKSGKKKS